MTRDANTAAELAHDLNEMKGVDFEELKSAYIDQAESGESTDWIEQEWAHELLAELAWMLFSPAHVLREDPEMSRNIARYAVRLSEMRERCKPYIDKWASKEAGKDLDCHH